MKLTKNQKNALLYIKEYKSIPIENSFIHKNTMNSLYNNGLINCPRYANGEFWELSDKGYELLNNLL